MMGHALRFVPVRTTAWVLAVLLAGSAGVAAQPTTSELPPLPERVKIHATLRLLADLGYTATVDETLKIDLESAIRQFQKDHDLPVDGRMTDDLLAALQALGD